MAGNNHLLDVIEAERKNDVEKKISITNIFSFIFCKNIVLINQFLIFVQIEGRNETISNIVLFNITG